MAMSNTSGTDFQMGDYIFHGSSGVCVVQDICTLAHARRSDPSRTYYRLQPIYEQGSVIYSPTDSTRMVRRVMNREEAAALVQEIPRIETIWIENEKTREECYREALKTNDFREWMRVIKTLYLRNLSRRQGGKRTTAVDERYQQTAENLLFGELAVALDIPKDEVSAYISRHILEGQEREDQCS